MKKIAVSILSGLFLLLFLANCSKPDGAGAQLYKENCAVCHNSNGEGIGTMMPPLANTRFIIENRERLACIISNGLNETLEINGVTYTNEMEAQSHLSEVEITNILNYIRESWYKNQEKFTLQEVNEQLNNCL